ncbi:phytanoyl-CoA dioxygenase family protein [Francisella philomiragia]|uniref:phytanoyl-CoA dioxygenase family protein n=1 Tax=Francisella philomiragia TaxID=28110 RepID=UPI0019070F79|nr:phytanoyl-CoA dioxygenase family protein [Francisella philomiragia]MBK2267747.1 phytanoyl-CoA dioxygenase family protein [Francisella philomiragia]MBK2308140.1 phytanoyl-CoA dioxygenase family protein [Francisella philomiragia]
MTDVYLEYSEKGFYLAKGLLDKSLIDITTKSLKKHFDNQLSLLQQSIPDNLYASMKQLHKLDIERYKKTTGSLWRKISLYNLHHDLIQSYVGKHFGFDEIVIPGGQVIHIQAESLKIPNGYFGFNPHQDYPSVQGSLDGFVVWIPLVDIDKNKYPLEVIPSSHKNGVLPSIEKDTGWEIKPEYYNEKDFIPLECQVGDVVFMSNFTVHRSSQTGDDRLRIACSTRYDNADEISFIERCYPSAYIRTVHREKM